jgi:hypothetical protein
MLTNKWYHLCEEKPRFNNNLLDWKWHTCVSLRCLTRYYRVRHRQVSSVHLQTYRWPFEKFVGSPITPSRNIVEVRWRSFLRSTSLGKRYTSYNAPPISRKRAADCLPQASGGEWNSWFWHFTFVSPSVKRFHHLKTAARLIASFP